ncbi:hypothetical protein [Leptospira meyeri]|uniref:hypothetical protein n=1 Tax=Leptospira meyeri TaxID=29508 RepID=UPI001FED8F84|nr:hypothetical protein [Leptospira meyeri]
MKKIDITYNEYVIHLERKSNWKNKEVNGKFYDGIIDSLKKCNLQNKRIAEYTGYSKFLNSSSESLQILSDNYKGNKPLRIDLHLILDDEETAGDSTNYSDNIPQHSSSKKYSKKLHNYNLYHYSITNPLINFEFMETIEYTAPTLTNKEIEDNFNFGKLFGNELCEALTYIN